MSKCHYTFMRVFSGGRLLSSSGIVTSELFASTVETTGLEIFVYVYVCACMYVCMCACVYVCTCMYVYMCTRVYVCACVCMYVYVHVYVYGEHSLVN